MDILTLTNRKALAESLPHKGWLGFFPVYIGGVGDESEPLTIVARHWSLDPLMWLAEQFECLRILASSVLIPDYEPLWMVRVTGER
jgi:hypothetical protein